ncbi:hypothetical protein A3Q56_00128 [Intoshia linei]|uniref:Uncharacterized protein n=1 Tax=Intoshia linei TaxID=1819745 RepID=A0A177BEW9_9BILA|nr:hypothetical protein A3Q56_00128 [Intoshia linei]
MNSNLKNIVVKFEHADVINDTTDMAFSRNEAVICQVDNYTYHGIYTDNSDQFDYYTLDTDQLGNIINVNPVNFIQMKPILNESKIDFEYNEEMTYMEKSDALNSKFGSVQSKRGVESRKRKNMNIS